MRSDPPMVAPLYPLLLRRALVEGAGWALMTVALAALLAPQLGAQPSFALKTLPVFPALAVAAGGSLHEHGQDTIGPANRLTMIRAVLVGLLAAFIGDPAAEVWSLPIVVIAVVGFGLDWLDGHVARRTGTASPFGARLDMELDAITVMVLSMLALSMGRAGVWVLLSGGLRYAFVVAGMVWPWMNRPLFSTPRRAWACGAQIVCLVACLFAWPVSGLSTGLAAAGLAVLVWSFAIDTAWLFARRREP